MSVSPVARQESVSASSLSQLRKLDRQGALTAVSASEAVVPPSELATACAAIAKLQRMLSKKALQREIIRKPQSTPLKKGGLRARPFCPEATNEYWSAKCGRSFEQLNEANPHSALKMRSPGECRRHQTARKIFTTRGHYLSDDAATELLWRALRNISADWSRPAREWKEAMNQFVAIAYGGRFTRPAS